MKKYICKEKFVVCPVCEKKYEQLTSHLIRVHNWTKEKLSKAKKDGLQLV